MRIIHAGGEKIIEMNDVVIPGGYILLARKIIDSEIWRKPPLYIKVWVYLLALAQHSDYKKLKKGQLFTSIPDIQKECSWYIGCRKVTPTKDQIYQVLEWMRKACERNCEHDMKATMIATTKATHGILITVHNYCIYQNPKHYESNGDGNDVTAMKATRKQRQPNNINKNDKNDKNYNIVPYGTVIEQFNSICFSLPKVESITDSRKSAINARWRQLDQSLDKLADFYHKVEASDFLTGRVKDWSANFDWIFKAQNFTKIIEGTYDNKNNRPVQKTKTEQSLDEFRRWAEEYDRANGNATDRDVFGELPTGNEEHGY